MPNALKVVYSGIYHINMMYSMEGEDKNIYVFLIF